MIFNSFVFFVVLLFDSLEIQIPPPPPTESTCTLQCTLSSGKEFFMAVIIKGIQMHPRVYYELLPVGLLTQLIRGLHQYHTGQGLNLSKAGIFPAFFFAIA